MIETITLANGAKVPEVTPQQFARATRLDYVRSTTTILNAEQLKALKEWAIVHGRTWKSSLRHAWETGDYDGIEPYSNTAAYLQQVRNNLGPSWLLRFVLPKSVHPLRSW